jgi:hypothetical protein
MVPLRQSATLARKRPDRTWAFYFPSGGGESSSEKVARRFFRLKAEAEAFCAVKRAEVASLGALANGLDDDVKREALLCGEKLKPFGVSLVVGYAVARVMLDFVSRRGLTPFGIWRIALGAIGLVLLSRGGGLG